VRSRGRNNDVDFSLHTICLDRDAFGARVKEEKALLGFAFFATSAPLLLLFNARARAQNNAGRKHDGPVSNVGIRRCLAPTASFNRAQAAQNQRLLSGAREVRACELSERRVGE
jgi:hypothetical protein